MSHELQFYIGGEWVAPAGHARLPVIDPSTGEAFTEIAMGTPVDVDRAVASARRAFASFSLTTPDERLALIRKILEAYGERYDEMAQLISREMGAPRALAQGWQAGLGTRHLKELIRTCETFTWQRSKGTTLITHEPIGVVALITPWNWPMNQIVCKVAPAIAAGCTMVLKPSEVSPLNALLFAEILDAAGVPPGVFNLVNGGGPTVGAALCSHPDVDMVSFTGSTRAGIQIAALAAPTVKRVHQELGGKSANLILDDADLDAAVTAGVNACFGNSGQSCNAPTRMFVPAARHEEAITFARRAAEAHVVGPADTPGTTLGPVVSELQFERIQRLIQTGVDEGARVVTGGTGRPEGLTRGYFVRPTVFAGVTPDMTIARDEIFGPVLAILPYRDEEDAIAMANDSVFGLAAYVQSGDLEHARRVAFRLRAGSVHLNYPAWDAGAPFGGYKQSGNGREYGEWGLEAFLEVKGIVGYGA
ncbi:aldehyde dehydrogenase [Caballeronia udeis]|uniref:aldehyde dehydrogenase (NAD(+)) n=1 Tax=Caballeronia udeis TaxID=1232866 RepID=A0A158HW65_9BURK|nr:aldehyde dehydrogenase family protein [Caballeronia udeis]SAL48131.1 aldehyde dehydrogenase [Caballeronia udeis]